MNENYGCLVAIILVILLVKVALAVNENHAEVGCFVAIILVILLVSVALASLRYLGLLQ